MHSMHGVSSALIARNESWVRKQASALARHLPSNVEKADLIQVGLIAVAQAALGFKWEGEGAPDSEEASEAFARYARMRVKGAMLDELRQMDHLGRAQRRKVKVVQIARERWQARHGVVPSLAELSGVCGMSVDEITVLEQAASAGRTESLTEDPDGPALVHAAHAATPKDEVEARVDTAIVLRHLEKFFATLPERERQVIDAYLGIGMTPVELAGSWQVSVSRVSHLFKSVLHRISHHLGHEDQRALGRSGSKQTTPFDEMVALREAELALSADSGKWGELMEEALTMPTERFGATDAEERMVVHGNTRW